MLKKLGRILTVLLVLAIGAALGAWLVFWQGEPWWVGVTAWAGVLTLYLLVLFIRAYLVRRREKKLVARVVETGRITDEEALPEILDVRELEKTWQANLALLRSSRAGRRGNPLYALPWYLVLGPPGVGKTTSLASSGLPASFIEVDVREGGVPTRTCDWWFLDNGIVLDTAGRYAATGSGAVTPEEWKRFLVLLARARKREPLSAVLVFVGADMLMEAGEEALGQQGQVLRNRINDLMRTLGFRIPVRLIVTRMDKVPGFTDMAASLSESERGQLMGYWNREKNPYWQEVLDQALRETGEALRRLRMNHVFSQDSARPGMLVLPMEISRLRKPLMHLAEPLFKENRFQETPLVGGLYFGSGACPSPDPGAGRRSYFFRDLFSRVLEDARERLEPVREYMAWRRVTRNLGLLCWIAFCIFALGMLGISYRFNRDLLAEARDIHVPLHISVEEDRGNQVATLEKLRLNILDLERANAGFLLPRLGLGQSLRAERELKAAYCRLFESTLIQPLEDGLARMVRDVGPATPDDVYADYMSYVVEQINLLQEVRQGRMPPLSGEFKPVVPRLLGITDTALFTEVAAFFSDMNLCYLRWNAEPTVTSRLKTLRSALTDLATARQEDTTWLYSSLISKSDPVRLSDFWTHRLPRELEDVAVPGAFTMQGRKEIRAFLEQAAAAGDAQVMARLRQRFEEAYDSDFHEHWHAFAEDFRLGRSSLGKAEDWREAAIRMTTRDAPYFRLISVMAGELRAWRDESGEGAEAAPPWAQAVVAFDEVAKLARAGRKAKEKKLSSLAARVEVARKEILEKSEKLSGDMALTTQLHLAAAWDAYEKGLEALEAATPYKEKTFQMLTDWFHDALTPDEANISLYGKAYEALVTLRGLARGPYDNSLALRLVSGPFDFLAMFAAREGAAVLQEQWREQVVAQTDEVDPDKLPGLLFDAKEGVVWKFVNTTAGPFLVKTTQGYRSREAFGRRLNFRPVFYTFLDKGAAVVVNRQSEYRVTMANRPLEVNDDAAEEPYSAVISVQCAENKIVLENDNYPRAQTFTWSPDTCGEVTLEIMFPGITLEKRYSGTMAFARFLRQFRQGALRLTPRDFPSAEGHLKSANIRWILLTYAIEGQEPILRLLRRRPVVPDVIITPEEQSGGPAMEPGDRDMPWDLDLPEY